MLKPRTVTAVIPTRGDVSLGALTDHLRSYPEIGEIRFVIGDTPFNRYRAMLEESGSEIFLTQDDDCVTDLRPLLDAYDRAVIVNAMTREHAAQYQGNQTLIGFGALFHRDLVSYAFYGWNWQRDDLFYRESDRIFPTVIPHKTVFPQISILPHASAPNRLWKQPDHNSARLEMNRRIFDMTGIPA
jgi:hypothetical protein